MTRRDNKLATVKQIRIRNKAKIVDRNFRVVNKFIRYLDKVVAEIPDVPQKDSIARTLDLIRVTLIAEVRNG